MQNLALLPLKIGLSLRTSSGIPKLMAPAGLEKKVLMNQKAYAIIQAETD